MGGLVEKLSLTDQRFSWERAQAYYLRAFSLRPQRIEPLICIANHYWPDNIPLCYLYAQYACQVNYHEHDALFVDKRMYAYTSFEILSRCAWHMGAFQQGLNATETALRTAPDTKHLLTNLQLYRDKVKYSRDLTEST
ncbi:MAG: hypothetical protein ACRCXC_00620 [Legionella sp.]